MAKVQLPLAPSVATLRPMLLDKRKHAAFSSPDWSYEIKYDGWRMLAEFGAGRVELRTRNGLDASPWFPEVCAALSEYKRGPHIIDGEVCVLDDLGRSDFVRLQTRAMRKCWYPGCEPVAYCVFDLLVHKGRAVMGLPLEERKAMLTRLFTPKPRQTLLVVSSIPESGEELFRLAAELQLEGLVAKRHGSVYVPGARSEDWRKLRRVGAVPAERFRYLKKAQG
jgi:bifunctional non-homologous end joining protein LigD